jgi:hypothetical protein
LDSTLGYAGSNKWKVVPTRSVRPLNPSEIHSEVEIKRRKAFDELIEKRHGTSINPPKPIMGESDSKEPDDGPARGEGNDFPMAFRFQRIRRKLGGRSDL